GHRPGGHMSVDSRRFVAAQRTAAASPRARAFRLASWLLIVPTLAFFSFSVVAGAHGYGNDRSHGLADAAQQLVPPAGAPHDPQSGTLVVVEAPKDAGNPLTRLFSAQPLQEVCWIGPRGLARVSAASRTTTATVSGHGRPRALGTVFCPNDHDL